MRGPSVACSPTDPGRAQPGVGGVSVAKGGGAATEGYANGTARAITVARRPRTGAVAPGSVDADVLVPQVGVGTDELRHQPDALRVVGDFERHAPGAEVVFRPPEGPVLPDDDLRDLVQQRGAAAHVARGEGGVEH